MYHHPIRLFERIGATGLLRGRGLPHQWDNQTWFDPDLPAQADSLFKYWNAWIPIPPMPSDGRVTLRALAAPLAATVQSTKVRAGEPNLSVTDNMLRYLEQEKKEWGLAEKTMDEPLTRAQLATVLDRSIDLYHLAAVDMTGRFLTQR
jgi:hypothetical protein